MNLRELILILVGHNRVADPGRVRYLEADNALSASNLRYISTDKLEWGAQRPTVGFGEGYVLTLRRNTTLLGV